MNRREALAAIAAVFTVALASPAALAQGRVGAGGAVPNAETFVSTLAQRGIADLTGRSTTESERSRRFRAMLVDNFDVPTIGRFALGRYWRVATEQERAEYMNLFTDMLVHSYASRFAEYQGEQVRVTGSRTTAEGDIIVASDVARPNQPAPNKVDWYLRRDGSSFKIVDVRVEGVSMAITQRDEFASIIQRGGGQIAALLQSMRTRAAPR
ncbi:MAG: ABC transporter substrate-binding protein [Alphaproteobacteria bacterium]|nr:ABC transporter substrate-binding protein [Alphaproteobacteria bacterium]